PVVGLRPGYRHISLRNESLQPLTLPTLFVHITVKDYVPDGLSELPDALANPIAYQSMVEKHARQLQILSDEMEDGQLSSDNNSKVVSGPLIESRNANEDDSNRQFIREASVSEPGNSHPSTKGDAAKQTELNGGASSSKVSSPNHKGF